MEFCPQLSDWNTYVKIPSGRDRKEVEGLFSEISPALNLPTYASLAKGRLRELQSILSSSRHTGVLSRGESSDLFNLSAKLRDIGPDVPKDILDHHVQVLETLFLSDEKVALEAINSYYFLRNGAKEESEERKEAEEGLKKAHQGLIQVHHGRTRLKKEWLGQRINQTREKLKMQEKKEEEKEKERQDFEGNIKLHKEAMELLEMLYDALAEMFPFSNVSNELCVVQQQISMLLDLSFSSVVAGLISVGKSTLVNCAIGENLSPNRTSVTTAIPTHYIHDPSAKEPFLLIPFYDQLNQVADAFRDLVNQQGFDETISLLKDTSVITLAKELEKGLTFKREYYGTQNIRMITGFVHDLFRLAVDEYMYYQVGGSLPLDWSRGLQKYLTVYTRFLFSPVSSFFFFFFFFGFFGFFGFLVNSFYRLILRFVFHSLHLEILNLPPFPFPFPFLFWSESNKNFPLVFPTFQKP